MPYELAKQRSRQLSRNTGSLSGIFSLKKIDDARAVLKRRTIESFPDLSTADETANAQTSAAESE